ncbi:phosphodiesterase [Pseudomonas benzopyrenica]|uniref:Phosphodiesterase n=1 Tax=Pseudomonas benzopyrenica TaxID=2993566 RepID=A0ABZ2FP79_9PSED|nr:phosphodiesterase [Pseudomonas psychrotolerans]UUW71912.1 phosphodiesterase [Pseudomonas psychrotolerans]
MKRPWLAALLLGIALPSWAETLQIPLGQQGQAGTPLPQRGDSRGQVLERFGLPDQEHPPVGRPPIRRWDYRDFSVYFENDRVLDAVREPRRPAPSP